MSDLTLKAGSTKREELMAKKAALASDMTKIDKAIEALDKNPELENLIDAIAACSNIGRSDY